MTYQCKVGEIYKIKYHRPAFGDEEEEDRGDDQFDWFFASTSFMEVRFQVLIMDHLLKSFER